MTAKEPTAAPKKTTKKKTAAAGTATTRKTAPKKIVAPVAEAPMSPPPSSLAALSRSTVSHEVRLAMIEQAAYFRAKNRNFEPGYEQEDWYLSEQDIDERIRQGKI